jgi:hypothetical protein
MDKRFLFHGLASGVSGHITLPSEHLIEVQAPSALPPNGGHSASRVECFRYEHILSFSAAHSVTTGNESGQHYNTLATAIIEGLNILNVVTADRVVARLASNYSKDKGEHSATLAGSRFENLRIAGCPVEVVMDPVRLTSLRRSPKAQLSTLAAPAKLEGCPGVERLQDGALYIPQFGKIYLAEYLSTACYQSLTMLRVVLGCAVSGQVSTGHVSTDGEPMPG